MISRQGAALGLLGVVVGIAGALVAARAFSTLLFATSSTDAPTFAVVTALLATATFLASWIPARRAMRVDPMVALRHD
jgi:putative ABC transport system permease protein